MIRVKTKFKDLYIFQNKKFNDKRGFLRELYLKYKIKKNLKFAIVSSSKKNVIRGMHFQEKIPQAKLISVVKGKILDVVVDIRKNSKTFGKYFKIILSNKNSKLLFVPKGFAHGFRGLDSENIVVYFCSNYRYKQGEKSIIWNDKKLNINWGIKKPIISKKDSNAVSFEEYFSKAYNKI
tara:strand:- start:879 stop:1415 length:537 start_codon:yes stop_codon:yes gene_type:complete